jgi:hypothetical protein
MAVVWSAICVLAGLAAGVQQSAVAAPEPQMRTRVLPGHGYIRYEVLPGDDESEAGELFVVHEERRPAPPAEEVAEVEEPPAPPRREQSVCSGLRAKLLARVFEMQGIVIEPQFAAWLERNLSFGTPEVRTIQLLGGEPLLLTALKTDGIARGLAEDLARCEAAQAR